MIKDDPDGIYRSANIRAAILGWGANDQPEIIPGRIYKMLMGRG